jgi:hypothetical protein
MAMAYVRLPMFKTHLDGCSSCEQSCCDAIRLD